MTQLAEILKRRIATEGPMTLAEYISVCLTHPDHGYYTLQTAIGAQGDFITAPEISQMFGEMLGLAMAQYWMEIGAPKRFSLVELGPGRGTLMADILRATKGIAGFHDAMSLILVEVSDKLRAEQAEKLAGYEPTWAHHIHEVAAQPDTPLFLIANEFFDALPIRQFIKTEKAWVERVIGLDGENNLQFGQAPEARLEQLEPLWDQVRTGEFVQLQSAAGIMDEIGHWIGKNGGLALIVDYGDWHVRADTFQAVQNHAYSDPLAAPGSADLTAHVDFSDLASAVPAGCSHGQLTTQGQFLLALGIAQRATQLAAKMTDEQVEKLHGDFSRLTDPGEMGSLFKVLSLYKKGQPTPPGISQ